MSRDEGYQLIKSADLLVVPVSFDSTGFDDICLSFPTKLPEYLASATPTLVYGPAKTAPVEFCRRHKLALVQDTRSIEGLCHLLDKIQREPEHFRSKAAQDSIFARENLSASTMRTRFEKLVADPAR